MIRLLFISTLKILLMFLSLPKIALDLWRSMENAFTWLYKLALSNTPYHVTSMELEDGVNKGLMDKICESTYQNDIAHMTLEIAKPKVLEVVKDVKVTFPDALGTIGKGRVSSWVNFNTTFFFNFQEAL
jgi:hypothetical protein